jgi:hypothetical protein
MTTSVRWKAIGTVRKEYKRGSELGVSSSCGYADTGGPDASLRRELSASEANCFAAREVYLLRRSVGRLKR